MGCVYNRYWYFRCRCDTCEFVGSWDDAAGEERPAWWDQASASKMCFIRGGDCSFTTWNRCSDISKTPRQNREAEEVALWLTGSLVAPDSAYSRILVDLALIRAAHGEAIPQARTLSYHSPWVTNELLVELTDQGIQQAEPPAESVLLSQADR